MIVIINSEDIKMYDYIAAKVVCKFEDLGAYKKGYDLGLDGEDGDIDRSEYEIKIENKDVSYNNAYYAGYVIGNQVGNSHSAGFDYGCRTGYSSVMYELENDLLAITEDISKYKDVKNEKLRDLIRLVIDRAYENGWEGGFTEGEENKEMKICG